MKTKIFILFLLVNIAVAVFAADKVEQADSAYMNEDYATAIKLAQDAVADIKKAGYNVSLEEIDTTNDYQIIIKLQK